MKKILLLFLLSFHFSFSQCTTPVNITINTITATTATISWTETSTATSWDILLLPCGSALPTTTSTGFVNSTSNPYTLSNLSPNTCYDLYIRAVCSLTEKSDWTSALTYTTPTFPPACGGQFTDSLGPNLNYTNNADETYTICPTIPGEQVSMVFTSFSIQENCDALYVFDGASISSPQILSGNPANNVPGGVPGGFWGTTIPGPFTSSSADGCLTFRFRSDGANTQFGWIANVVCQPPSECFTPTNLTVSSITNTSAVVGWNEIGVASLWELYVIPSGSPAPSNSTQGVLTQSNPFVISGLLPDTCYSVYVRSACNPGIFNGFSVWSQPSTFCMYDCSNNAQCPSNLTLIAFLDTNNNGVKDVNEAVFNNGSFAYDINNSGNSTYGSYNNGNFSIFENNPSNSYALSFILNPNLIGYYNSSTTFSNITVPLNSGSNNYYFPITQIQLFNDVEIFMISNNSPVPGFNYGNTLYYKNNGEQTIANGTLTFSKDALLTITSVSQGGTISTTNGFTYNFTNLAPNEQRSIYINMTVPTIPTVSLGTLITNSTTISSSLSDAIATNNSDSLSQLIVGSYDPNDKKESHGGKIQFANFTSNDYLTYTIQFENTGTANAQFIRVEDFLDSTLNVNSVEVLNASHSFNFRRINNKLIWNFYTINLPPTILNPSMSHGFVKFRVKPNPGFSVGTIIPNAASIFFDYNPPIITETCITEFVQSLSNSTFDSSGFIIYPNPTKAILSIQNTDIKIATITITDTIGKVINEIKGISSNNYTLDISNLSNGIYFIEITSENNTKSIQKLVKN